MMARDCGSSIARVGGYGDLILVEKKRVFLYVMLLARQNNLNLLDVG